MTELPRGRVVARLSELLVLLRPYAAAQAQLDLINIVNFRPTWSREELAATIAAVAAADAESLDTLRETVNTWWTEVVVPPIELDEVASLDALYMEDLQEPEAEQEKDIDRFATVVRQQFRTPVLRWVTWAASGLVSAAGLIGMFLYIAPDLGSTPVAFPCGGEECELPIAPEEVPKLLLLLAAFTFVATIAFSVTIQLPDFFNRRARRAAQRQEQEITGDMPEGSSFLPLGLIGGDSITLLDRDAKAGLARAIPMRDDDAVSSRLDEGATVQKWSKTGRPSVVFRPIRVPWSVIILDDRSSAARPWAKAADQVADAFESGGVNYLRAEYNGRMDRIRFGDGQERSMQVLISMDSLIVICSDGAALLDPDNVEEDVLMLRRLSASRRVLWVDDREPRFWQPHTDVHLRMRPALPVCAADDMSLIGMAAKLGSGYSTLQNEWPEDRTRAVVLSSDLAHGTRRALILGDAVDWAAASSVIQPISVGLADAIRQAFFPHLSALAFGRLALLDGVQLTSDGLSFSPKDLQYLRRRFSQRTPEIRQEQIFALIEASIAEFQRDLTIDEESLAARMLQLHEATFLYDRGQTKGAEKLGDLSQTLLLDRARDVVERHVMPQQASRSSADVPQFRKPEDFPATWEHLRLLARPPALELPRPWVLSEAPSARLRLEGLGNACAFDPQTGRMIVLGQDGQLVLGGIDGEHVLVSESRIEASREVSLALSRKGVFASVAGESHIELYTSTTGITYLPQESPVELREIHFQDMAFFEPSENECYLAVIKGSGELLLFQLTAEVAERLNVDLGETTQVIAIYPDDALSSGRLYALTFDGLYEFLSQNEDLAPRTKEGADFGPPLPARLIRTEGLDWVKQMKTVDAIAVCRVQAPVDPEPDPSQVILAVAKSERLYVQFPDGQVYGPWSLPPGRVSAMEIGDRQDPTGPSITLLVDGVVEILHAQTGVRLNSRHDANQGRHAALGVDRNVALIWTEQRDALEIYSFERPNVESPEDELDEPEAARNRPEQVA